MYEHTVGICCVEKSYALFKEALDSTGLKPDKVLKDDNGQYYIVFDFILWDSVLHKKIAPCITVMDVIDNMLAPFWQWQENMRLDYDLPLLRDAMTSFKRAEDKDAFAEDYLYKCITWQPDSGITITRGTSDMELDYEWTFQIPESAVPVAEFVPIDNPVIFLMPIDYGSDEEMSYCMYQIPKERIQDMHDCVRRAHARFLEEGNDDDAVKSMKKVLDASGIPYREVHFWDETFDASMY